MYVDIKEKRYPNDLCILSFLMNCNTNAVQQNTEFSSFVNIRNFLCEGIDTTV